MSMAFMNIPLKELTENFQFLCRHILILWIGRLVQTEIQNEPQVGNE
jgi:hypothetical protein